MLSQLKVIVKTNQEELDKFISPLADQINNVDISLCSMVDVDIREFKLKDSECHELYNYLYVLRIISQVALNRYRNNKYYNKTFIGNIFIDKMVSDEDDREELSSVLHNLTSDREYRNDLLFDVFKMSTGIYLILCKIIQSMENIERGVTFQSSDLKKDVRLSIEDNTNVGGYSDGWKCPMCNTHNDSSLSQCEVCEDPRSLHEDKQAVPENIHISYDVYDRKGNVDHCNEESSIDFVREQSETRWKCDKCTYLNVYNDDHCSVCQNLGPHLGRWRCEKCTMSNDKLVEHCGACDESNPFLIKCPICLKVTINRKCDNLCGNCISNSNIDTRDFAESMDIDEGVSDMRACLVCKEYNSQLLKQCGFCGKSTIDDTESTAINFNETSICNGKGYEERYSKTEDGSGVFQPTIQKKSQHCLICSEIIDEENQKLCLKCRYQFHICANQKCRAIYRDEFEFCNCCGVRKYSGLDNCNIFECNASGQVMQMWQCPFRGCLAFNGAASSECITCRCMRQSFSTYKCQGCGWVFLIGSHCVKCLLYYS